MQEEKICPYPGLRPFNEEESIFFRGREEHIEKITSQLQEKKFVMLTGASGDGKSSIVYAGVIPNARAGFFKAKFNNWLIADFRPERSPLKNMAITLAEKLGYTDIAYVEKELSFGFSSLINLYKKSPFYLDYNGQIWNSANEPDQKKLKRKAANLFILVDQFEEFFTNSENYNNGKASVNAQAVINLLLETAKIALAEDLPIYIICTMRSDYVGQCAVFRGLPEYIGFSQFFVPRLKRKEVHQVIEEPATLSGNKISNRLIETLINECEGLDQLPILQHALNSIWKCHVQDNAAEMDIIHYAKVGGIDGKLIPEDQKIMFSDWYNNQPEYKQKFLEGGSLANVLNAHARELFESSVDYCRKHIGRDISREDAHRILKKIFTCLTKINDSRAVRNRATILEVKQIIGEKVDNKLIEGLVNIFREPGNTLLKPYILSSFTGSNDLNDEDILDITHESLIRNWTELAEWTKQDHENVSVINDLKKQVERWEEQSRSKDYLLTIGSLTYFKNWYKTLNPNPYLIAKYDTSNLSPAQKLEEASQFIRPAADYIKISEKTIKRKRRAALVIASVVGLILIGFTSFAFKERNKALNQQEIANQKTEEAKISENLANKAKNNALNQMSKAEMSEKFSMKAKKLAELSKQEAVYAKGVAENAEKEARQNLIQAKQNADRAQTETDRATLALTESEKAKQDAIVSKNKAEKAEKEASRISNISLAQSIALKSVLFYDDPQYQSLLAFQAYKFTLDNGGEGQDPVIFSAVRSAYNNLNKQGAAPKMFPSLEQRTLLIVDNNTMLSADKGGNIYKWELKSEKQIEQGKLKYPSPFEIITFTDWPNIVISGHENGTVCIWDITDYKKPVLVKELIKSHIGPLRVIAYNGLKSLFATSGKDSIIVVWKYSAGGAELLKKIKASSLIQDLVVLPDGKELAVSLANGDLLTIDLSSEKTNLVFKSEKSKPVQMKFNSRKSILAVGYSDGKIRLYDTEKVLRPENLISTISENNATVEKITFNGSSNILAVAFADKSIKIFNLAKKVQKPLEIKDIKSKSRYLLFDNEGKLYVCGADHFIRKIEPSTEKLSASFCDLLKRNLTSTEWSQNISETIPYEKTCKNK
ncbi:MAG: hypothetical protein V4547_15640 [Bacteroidota bacterium]